MTVLKPERLELLAADIREASNQLDKIVQGVQEVLALLIRSRTISHFVTLCGMPTPSTWMPSASRNLRAACRKRSTHSRVTYSNSSPGWRTRPRGYPTIDPASSWMK